MSIKARLVEADEREAGPRALLNLGHTFGHVIEPRPELDLRHGEAVAIGMVAAAHAACDRGWLDADDRDRIVALIRAAGLPVSLPKPAPTSALIDAMIFDKKVRDGLVRLVLPTGIGAAGVTSDTPDTVIRAAWASVGADA